MKKHANQKKLRSRKTGLPPGALVHVGEVRTAQPLVTIIDYCAESISERSLTLDEAKSLSFPAHGIHWINVYGLHDPSLIAGIGNNFGLHPLVLEDILNTDQRPKVDSFEHNLYLVTRFFQYNTADFDISSDQVSIVLGRNFVLTFQERQTGAFDPVRERLRTPGSHLRQSGADYLAYSLLDIIVDRYFIVLEQMGNDCETLEEALIKKPHYYKTSPILISELNNFLIRFNNFAPGQIWTGPPLNGNVVAPHVGESHKVQSGFPPFVVLDRLSFQESRCKTVDGGRRRGGLPGPCHTRQGVAHSSERRAR